MKTFLLAIAVTVFVITGTCFYIHYLNETTRAFDESAKRIEAFVEENDWDACKKEVEKLENNWKKQNKILSAFTDHAELDEIKKTLNVLSESVRFHDSEETHLHTKELRILTERMRENEYPTLKNIL